jgi:hypothetical protein
MTEPTSLRFPAPWTAVELQESFRIEDAKGFPLAYVYSRMSRDEARCIALNIASLPDLRAALREKDDG